MAEMKSIILKALQRSQDLPLDEQAEMVVRYLDIASDIALVPAPQPPPLSPPPSPRPSMQELWRPAPADEEFDEPAVLPSRLTVRPQEVSALTRSYRTVDEIASYLESRAPKEMEVPVPGAPKPMRLIRRIEAHEPLDMVKLSYIPAGQADGPAVILSTTDEKIGLEKHLQEIREVIRHQYSGTPRKVLARAAVARPEGADMVGGEASDHEGLSNTANAIFGNRSDEEIAELRRK